jgi:hypothetical protein
MWNTLPVNELPMVMRGFPKRDTIAIDHADFSAKIARSIPQIHQNTTS